MSKAESKLNKSPLSDGTGRVARDEQRKLFIDLQDSELEADVIGANAVTGIGKSFIARAIQRGSDSCDIITSSNALISQYRDTYPELNAVMGKDKYDSAEEYHEAGNKAKSGTPSIFNPLSYHFARVRGLRRPDRIFIDEAHLFVDMLTYQAAQVIPIARTNVPENAKNEGDLIEWCYSRYNRLKKAISLPNAPSALFQEFERVAQLRASLEEGTQNHVFQISKDLIKLNGGRPQKCLILTPVRVPQSLIKAVTDARKVIAVSGTMTRYDTEIIAAGRSFKHMPGEYLTPPENRPVYFNPIDPDLRRDPQALADKIDEIYSANPVPTLVHVTYHQSIELRDLLSKHRPFVNKAENKAEVKERFVKYGGLWLASGVSEGLDLPGSQCQQMILPTLLYPDRSDLFVQKRVGLSDGDYWYKVRTMQNTIQRLGRGVRSIDDKCVSHVLDHTFARLHEDTAREFAKMNVHWSKF